MHKICNKICIKYARNMTNMQVNMTNMQAGCCVLFVTVLVYIVERTRTRRKIINRFSISMASPDQPRDATFLMLGA